MMRAIPIAPPNPPTTDMIATAVLNEVRELRKRLRIHLGTALFHDELRVGRSCDVRIGETRLSSEASSWGPSAADQANAQNEAGKRS
jgi:hypothetical protein